MSATRCRVKCAPALACAAAIAYLQTGCDLTQPNLRKTETIGRSGRLVEPKRCTLTVVILTRPADERTLTSTVWQSADEQVVDPDLRRALQTNGLRLGRIAGGLPAEVQELLRATPSNQPNSMTIANPSGHSSLIDPAQTAPQSHLNLLVSQPDGRVRGRAYDDAKAYLRITPTHDENGGVMVRVVPELHHGPVQRAYGMVPGGSVPSPHEFQLGSGQKVEAFQALMANVVLRPGVVLAIGGRTDRPGSLGDLLFEKPDKDGNQRLQSLVLIWAARNQGGDTDRNVRTVEPPPALLPAEEPSPLSEPDRHP